MRLRATGKKRGGGAPSHFRAPAVAAIITPVVAALWLSATTTTYAWGPEAHRLVTNWAIQTLPAELRGFFEANRATLASHANDPEQRMKTDPYERMRHYIFLDEYGLFPYLKLPHSYKAAVARYGLRRLGRSGILPWQIGHYSLRLTDDFKSRNWQQLRLDAAALAYYVADAHNPLNTTQDYDGRLIGAAGLAERFGSALVDKYKGFFLIHPDAATKIDDPTEYAFRMVLEANTWVGRVILEDARARGDLPGYTGDYFDRFYTGIGPTAVRELNLAAHDVGCYWYTAWVNAGRPQLPAR